MDRLTIAIPSYNRTSLLIENIKLIADNLPEWIHILVIDNCSSVPVIFDNELIQKLSERNVSYEIIRNSCNIGGGANILRCFEYVRTEWFLLCGDDDLIDPLQLDEIWKITQSERNLAFIKLSSHFHQYQTPIKGTDITCFLNISGNFNSLLFMSTYVFNRPLCLPFLRFGYLMNGAYAPHLAIALLTSNIHNFILSPINCVTANKSNPQWSPTDVVLSAYYLSDLPLKKRERSLLLQKIYKSHNIGREILDIIVLSNNSESRSEARFLLWKAIRVHLFFGTNIKRIIALPLLIISPLFGKSVENLLTKAYLKTSGREYTRKIVGRHHGL